MSELSDILGQNLIIESVLNIFDNNPNQVNVVFIEGPSGTGKSFLVSDLLRRWKDLSKKNEGLILKGDVFQGERPLYPFNSGLAREMASIEKRQTIKKGASEMVKGIPFAGDFVGFLLEKLTNFKSDNNQSKLWFLKKEELDLILGLNSFYRNSHLLIVADNLHWWDESSVSLLNAILSDQLRNFFPFLKAVNVIGIITNDQTCLAKSEIEELRLKWNPVLYKTKKLNKQEFTIVLSRLGINYLNKKIEELIFNLSGGHLEIVKSLFPNIPLNDFQSINESLESELIKGEQTFLERIFFLRLKNLGAQSEQIVKLLEYASVIGLNFNFEEILCLTKENEETLRQIILKAQDTNLIEGNEYRNSFTHEIIREFFWCRIQSKKSEYFKTFANCLAQLRPGSYFQRANILLEAGLVKDSLIVYLLGYFKNIHDGLTIPTLVVSRIDQLCQLHNFDDYFVLMKKAYTHFLNGSYEQAKHLIWEIEDIYPEPLLAEKYYLLSLCLPKNLNKQDLVESKDCLLNWDSLKTKESELWVRIMLTLMSRFAHLNEYQNASAIERKIMQFLTDRIAFDPSAEYGLNILRRKASILHIGEIACKRTSLSISFFGTSNGLNGARFPIQYYMSLGNHSGNLITTGEFESACHFAEQTLLCIENYPEISFPRAEIPVNNFIIAGFLANRLTSSQALEIYDKLFLYLENVENHILLQNNYLVFKAINNDLEVSLKLVEKLNDYLQSTTRNDTYYHYFVGINRAVIYFLIGQTHTAKEMITELKLQIPNIPDKHFLQRRHEVLQILIQEGVASNPRQWNDIILENYPQEIGPSWKMFGRGFLLSDMQFWSDS